MAIDYEKLKNRKFDRVVQSYDFKDAALYALGVGVANDPLDREQLRFVYEESNFQVLPTMATILASPGFWMREPDTGIDWKNLLNGESGVELYRPLPVAAKMAAETRISEVVDKGPGKGALIYAERTLVDLGTEEAVAKVTSTSFARNDGGFGGPAVKPRPTRELPERTPDFVCELSTLPQAALIYRLCGDLNPLHADPDIAISAGFERPILHGLCTLGVGCHAIVREVCKYNASSLTSFHARFVNPVYPGDTIRTEMWVDGEEVAFRSSVPERGVVILSNGFATLGR